MQVHQGQPHLDDHVAGDPAAVGADAVHHEPPVGPLGGGQAQPRLGRVDPEADRGVGGPLPPVFHRGYSRGQDHLAARLQVDLRPSRQDGRFEARLGWREPADLQALLGHPALRCAVRALGARAVQG